MLSNTRKPKNGFTIIEIMIVLAIAGLIMLIIFLAVPALQRSARNTQRKNDTSAIASAIANFIDNNGGTLPTSVGFTDSADLLICGASCVAPANTETAKLGYYTATGPADVTLVTSQASPATPTSTTVVIDTGYNCNTSNTGLGSVAGRSAAILYAVETSTSTVSQQCVEQ